MDRIFPQFLKLKTFGYCIDHPWHKTNPSQLTAAKAPLGVCIVLVLIHSPFKSSSLSTEDKKLLPLPPTNSVQISITRNKSMWTSLLFQCRYDSPFIEWRLINFGGRKQYFVFIFSTSHNYYVTIHSSTQKTSFFIHRSNLFPTWGLLLGV